MKKVLLSLAGRVPECAKAWRKSKILQTRPNLINEISELKFRPKLEVADTLEINPFTKYIKEHFGRYIYVSENPRRNPFSGKMLDLPPKYGTGIGGIATADASTYAMDITRKERALELAKTNPTVAKNLADKPYLVELSEEESISKIVLDNAFKNVAPLEENCLEYRGAMLKTNSPFYKQISELKKGDIYREPGYIWTSPDRSYAHGRYSAVSACEDIAQEQASIRYHILLPKGSKMICVDRVNPETLIKGQFKVCDFIKDGNNIDLFVEHIPC
ncbi:MAG: hypothetical protein MJ231_08380 [bacterium]|nr:hypothetical protein [bacterium]